MGIKDLHKVLETHAPHIYRTAHLSSFAFKKVGIDVSLYLYKFKASLGPNWITGFLNMVSTLRQWDIHCFYVFDGKAPVEKLEEQRRRREIAGKNEDRILLLEQEIAQYRTTGQAGPLMLDINQKQDIKVSIFRPAVAAAAAVVPIDLAWILSKLETMKSNVVVITPADYELLRRVFDLLGVPYATAPDEAERFAARLCYHGRLDAVLSEDTDVLCYQTPTFLLRLDLYKDTVVTIDYRQLMEALQMTPASFLDLCIMLGCDYNTNLMDHGSVKSFKLIRDFGSIEAAWVEIQRLEALKVTRVERRGPDLSVLKHHRCRELFSVGPPLDFKVPFCATPGSEAMAALSELLFKNGIHHYNLSKLFSNLKPRTIVLEK